MVRSIPTLSQSFRRASLTPNIRVTAVRAKFLSDTFPPSAHHPLGSFPWHPPRRLFYHTMPSSGPRSEPFPTGSHLQGDSGRVYSIQGILSDRRNPLLCVYRASSQGKIFIMKDMIRGEFEYQKSLQQPLVSCPNLRVVVDTIAEDEIFVYDFLAGDLLEFSRRPLSVDTRKSILRSALSGLAELHDRGIPHTDIKPNNILIDYENETSEKEPKISQIRISDLEDAVLLKHGRNIKGCLCGNELWRSPESWARARQNTSSDVYSFAIVAIYVMLDEIIFCASDEELAGDMAWWHVLRRHISYFGDEEGFQGLLSHVGQDDPFFERLVALAGDFDSERPRKPFKYWHYVDGEFQDLVGKMTNLDPKRRITAREALQHPWFRDTKSQ